jgi:hypothetical protein
MTENPYQAPSVPNEPFDPTEAQIVAAAGNPALTKRRIFYSILAPLALIALMLTMFWHAQPPIVVWLFAAYAALTMFERVGYGLAVLSYKSVIRKLLLRVSELEVR